MQCIIQRQFSHLCKCHNLSLLWLYESTIDFTFLGLMGRSFVFFPLLSFYDYLWIRVISYSCFCYTLFTITDLSTISFYLISLELPCVVLAFACNICSISLFFMNYYPYNTRHSFFGIRHPRTHR
jgi:hypothetical protein